MNTLKNLKLIGKLAIPVAILIAVSLGMVLLARSNLNTLDAITRDTVEVSAGRVIRVQQLAFAIDETTLIRYLDGFEAPDGEGEEVHTIME